MMMEEEDDTIGAADGAAIMYLREFVQGKDEGCTTMDVVGVGVVGLRVAVFRWWRTPRRECEPQQSAWGGGGSCVILIAFFCPSRRTSVVRSFQPQQNAYAPGTKPETSQSPSC